MEEKKNNNAQLGQEELEKVAGGGICTPPSFVRYKCGKCGCYLSSDEYSLHGFGTVCRECYISETN